MRWNLTTIPRLSDVSKLVFEDEEDVDMVVEWWRGGGEEDVVFDMI